MKKIILFLSIFLAIPGMQAAYPPQTNKGVLKKAAKISARFLEASAGLALGAYNIFMLKPDFFKDIHVVSGIHLSFDFLKPKLNVHPHAGVVSNNKNIAGLLIAGFLVQDGLINLYNELKNN